MYLNCSTCFSLFSYQICLLLFYIVVCKYHDFSFFAFTLITFLYFFLFYPLSLNRGVVVADTLILFSSSQFDRGLHLLIPFLSNDILITNVTGPHHSHWCNYMFGSSHDIYISMFARSVLLFRGCQCRCFWGSSFYVALHNNMCTTFFIIGLIAFVLSYARYLFLTNDGRML